jgi:hypothetical protein
MSWSNKYKDRHANRQQFKKATINLDNNEEFPGITGTIPDRSVITPVVTTTISYNIEEMREKNNDTGIDTYINKKTLETEVSEGWTLFTMKDRAVPKEMTSSYSGEEYFDSEKARFVFENIVERETERRKEFIEIHGIDYYEYYYSMPNYQHMPDDDNIDENNYKINNTETLDEYDYDY